MAYNSDHDEFKLREPTRGDQVLLGYLNADGEIIRATVAAPYPVAATLSAGDVATLEAIETATEATAASAAQSDIKLGAMENYLDGLEALLTTLDGRVDTLEALLAPLVPGGNLVDTTGTAGTPEQINAGNSQACRGVMLSNWSSSAIAAGFSNAVDVALKTGVQIGAGKSMFFPCTNTNQIWVDVTTNGDAYGGVYYT